jgi:hypothetical protein
MRARFSSAIFVQERARQSLILTSTNLICSIIHVKNRSGSSMIASGIHGCSWNHAANINAWFVATQ